MTSRALTVDSFLRAGLKKLGVNRIARALLSYVGEARKLRKENPRQFSLAELFSCFRPWYRSLDPGLAPVTDEQPWVTFGACAFLDRHLHDRMRVYEYGSGGSTLYFLRRAGEVCSVEHDPVWGELVAGHMRRYAHKRWLFKVIEPSRDLPAGTDDPSDPDTYASGDERYSGCSFREYAASIDVYPDGYFDVVLIDGRARNSCFKHAAGKVRPGGFLVLDNAERPRYRYIRDRLHEMGWLLHDFQGPGPYDDRFWETCIWQRPIDR